MKFLTGATLRSTHSAGTSLPARLAGFLCDAGTLATLAIVAAGLLAAFFPLLDGLNHFQPFWTAAAVGTFALAWLSGSRLRMQRAGSLALVSCYLLLAPVLRLSGSSLAASQGTQVKVMTFNAYWFNQSPALIVAHILAEQPDIVLLQETGRRMSDALNEALRGMYPHRRFCNDSMGCDSALLSKWPWREIKHVLKTDNVPPGIAAVLQIGDGRTVRVIGLHMTNPAGPRRQQREIAWLTSFLGRPTEPTILAGDFNLTPWTFTLRRVERDTGLVRHTGLAGTWPAGRRYMPALFPIDTILSSSHFKPVSIQSGPWLGSDHLPVTATLMLR